MYFDLPMKIIASINNEILDRANQRLIEHENKKEYVFKYKDWLRLDSYNNPENLTLDSIVGQEIIDEVMKHFSDSTLFGWSLSHLPGKTKIDDHVDRMMLHRLARRIIVPISNTPNVLNWHYSSDKITKRYYTFDYGHIYRLNTSSTHGLVNNNSLPRRAIYFDVMPTRLYNKFKDDPDIEKVILMKASGIIYVL